MESILYVGYTFSTFFISDGKIFIKKDKSDNHGLRFRQASSQLGQVDFVLVSISTSQDQYPNKPQTQRSQIGDNQYETGTDQHGWNKLIWN